MTFDRPTEAARRTPEYLYRAQVENVVDGDTWDVRIDTGYEIRTVERVRAIDIDTREIHFVPHDSEEYKRGIVHTEYVKEWVEDARDPALEWPFVLFSHEYSRGTYGRVLGDLYSPVIDEWLTNSLINTFDDVEKYDD